MVNKPQVGQMLFEKCLFRYKGERRAVPVEVIKVGRQYFTVAEKQFKDTPHMHNTYRLQDWRHKSNYGQQFKLYESEQAYKDEEEYKELAADIKEFFTTNVKNDMEKCSLENLRAAHKLIIKGKPT